MKYRSPETGEVYEDIEAAYGEFDCSRWKSCDSCVLGTTRCNIDWITSHPTEAARLMGLVEIVRAIKSAYP